MAYDIDTVFRDDKVKGDIHSGAHWPDKPEIRGLLKQIQSGGGQSVTRNTIAALNAVTPPNEDYMGIVLTGSAAGLYSREAGAWVFGRGYPDTFAKVALAGSGATQTGVVNTGVNPASTEVFFAKVTTPNTGPLTLSISGGPARQVINLAGNPLSAGEWTGMVMFYLNDANQYQLLIDAGAAASAAASATEASEALSDILERYLGALADDAAATAAAGGLPVTGQMYFNTTDGKFRVWTGAIWQDQSTGLADGEVTLPKLANALVQTDAEARDDAADDQIPTVKRVVTIIKDVAGFGIIPNCVGDGTANDTSGFLAACITAMTLGVWVELDPKKTYNLATWTALSTTGRLRIKGNGALIKGPGAGGGAFNSYFIWTVSGAGFDIDGARWENWYGLFQRWNYKWGTSDPLFPGGSGINIGAQTDTLVDSRFTNNAVTGCAGFVFSIGIRIERMLVEGNAFVNCSGGYVIRLGEKVVGEFEVSWRGIRIRRNKFLNTTGGADQSTSPIILYCGQAEVSFNEVTGVTSLGAGEAWGMYFQGADMVVQGNHIRNVTNTGTATDITGISMKGAQDDSDGYIEQSGLSGKVYGNICRNIGSGTVWGTGIKAQARRTQVFANELSGCTYAGVAMDNLLGSQDQSVINNVMVGCKYGAILTGNGGRYQIKDNSMYLCDVGVYFAAGPYLTNVNCVSTQISGNMIGNSGGIGLQFYFAVTVHMLDVTMNHLVCDVAIKYLSGGGGAVASMRLLDNNAALSNTNTDGTAPAGITIR